jgi:hypothetical protein
MLLAGVVVVRMVERYPGWERLRMIWHRPIDVAGRDVTRPGHSLKWQLVKRQERH